ncbi:hypothetical protein HanXRQr2_Chr15g0707231 [Helianthus annuus]|uniref:Uncharacterized protein n=1 Tax=Helianthus annuus TaxID=4232 RepID=A0A9K3E3R0_HELAN|nr:hypothetical protein HanXRQr2_Chr15g0707231 [Helianthus annuus]KAJ0832434.1 hypothetical protein HanPSC8_Chr15g0678751 [Helianthus annuus]
MNSQVILEIVGLNLKVAGVHERLHLPHTELEINLLFSDKLVQSCGLVLLSAAFISSSKASLT